MKEADANLEQIKNHSHKLTPEDRDSSTMELQEDEVPKDAQDFKVEMNRINDYVTDLKKRTLKTCEEFSEDVKYWAEYKTGIRGFKPWLESSEEKTKGGLSKPSTL